MGEIIVPGYMEPTIFQEFSVYHLGCCNQVSNQRAPSTSLGMHFVSDCETSYREIRGTPRNSKPKLAGASDETDEVALVRWSPGTYQLLVVVRLWVPSTQPRGQGSRLQALSKRYIDPEVERAVGSDVICRRPNCFHWNGAKYYYFGSISFDWNIQRMFRLSWLSISVHWLKVETSLSTLNEVIRSGLLV